MCNGFSYGMETGKGYSNVITVLKDMFKYFLPIVFSDDYFFEIHEISILNEVVNRLS